MMANVRRRAVSAAIEDMASVFRRRGAEPAAPAPTILPSRGGRQAFAPVGSGAADGERPAQESAGFEAVAEDVAGVAVAVVVGVVLVAIGQERAVVDRVHGA